jgi:hypothetical protein
VIRDATPRAQRVVALLDIEPELAAGIPAEELPLARRIAVAPRLDLPSGRWDPDADAGRGDGAYALMVVDGLLTRTVVLADRAATQLLGPGDILMPWQDGDTLLPAAVEWTCNVPAQLAVLDDRTIMAARRWPALFRALHDRTAAQTARLAMHNAIAQLPRVDTRIVAVLWHLAERFGRVTPSGVLVPLKLTHEALGHLIGAQRPTVTLALRALTEEGVLARTDDGAWILRDGSHDRLGPAGDGGAEPGPSAAPERTAPAAGRPPRDAWPGECRAGAPAPGGRRAGAPAPRDRVAYVD